MMIDLNAPLTLANAFRFPLQNAAARRDLLIGGCILFIPVVGFMLNMGYRLHVVHNLQQGKSPWPGWHSPIELLKHGAIATLAIVAYHLPAVACLLAWWNFNVPLLAIAGGILWAAATFTLPGFMTFYCIRFDAREVCNPVRAVQRALSGGRPYLHAWGIGICGVLLSFTGILALGVGFAFTSVWFWQVAAFCFANVFSEQHQLVARAN